jgi:hypothetical protein
MQQLLSEFEGHTGLVPKQACLLLGIAYVTYAHYRSGTRELPYYHIRHIHTIYRLSGRQLQELIKEVTTDGTHERI